MDIYNALQYRFTKTASSPQSWVYHNDGSRTPSAMRPPFADLLAGVDALYLHTFRHTAAHHWLLDGGTEVDLQTRAGWSSPQMLRRYASTTRSERSHAAHERFGLGDKL